MAGKELSNRKVRRPKLNKKPVSPLNLISSYDRRLLMLAAVFRKMPDRALNVHTAWEIFHNLMYYQADPKPTKWERGATPYLKKLIKRSGYHDYK